MNSNWFIKFEEYLQGEMSIEEKALFESELSSNEEMNRAFNIYRTIENEMAIHHQEKRSEEELKNTLESLNARYFEQELKKPTKVVPLHSTKIFKSIMALAASLLLLLVAYSIFFQSKQDVRLLADIYIDTHFMQLSQTMDSTPDSLQLGISAYNNQEYSKALQFFQGVQEMQPGNVEAIKNMGLSYLMNKEYELALQKFDELAAIKNLYSNEGLFLKAITLMQRNEKGDKEEAKSLLEQVVEDDEAGSEQAKEWLKKF